MWGSGLGKNAPRTQKKDQICTGYLVSEPSDDGGRRWLENWEAARFRCMPAAHKTGLPHKTSVRPYQSRNDSAGTAHLSYGSSKRSDSGAGGEHTAVTVVCASA